MENLHFTIPGLHEGERFPLEYTGRGEDLSPEFQLYGIPQGAKTLAITLDDMSLSTDGFSHWVIWNLPVKGTIPAEIPAGARLREMGNAIQGIGYGRHMYAGPKPPHGSHHDYKFTVYALDTVLNIDQNSGRDDFLRAAKGHILQQSSITGVFE